MEWRDIHNPPQFRRHISGNKVQEMQSPIRRHLTQVK
jgi:hypothetical protein